MEKRKASIVILLLLIASMAISISPLSNAATTTGSTQTYAFLGLSRNPIGIGQTEVIDVGIPEPVMTGSGWTGLSVTVVQPDGKTTTINDITTNPDGGVGVNFNPTEVGNYTLQSHFPAQWYNYSGLSMFGVPTASNILYEASDSPNVTLIVQQNPVPDYPYLPLPTSYWTRPINDQLYGWSTLGGNWLVSWDFNPAQNFVTNGNDQAPQSSHMLWTKPYASGGIVGGSNTNVTYPEDYDTGEAYEYEFAGSTIINGILYYNEYPSSYATASTLKTLVALDLRTGQVLWQDPGVYSNYAQILTFSTNDQHGTYAYIWARNGTMGLMGPSASAPWIAYDAATGAWVYTMTNVPSGTMMIGPNGEILILVVNQAMGWMALWNSSAIPALRGGPYGSNGAGLTWLYETWRPYGLTIDAQAVCPVSPENPLGISGYSWNVTIPKGLPGSVVAAFPDDLLYGYSRGATVINQVTISGTTDQFYAWAVSLNTATRGQLLWNKTEPLPAGNLTITAQFGPQDAQSGVFCVFLKELRQWVGYSLTTGNQLWTTTPQNYMDQYSTIGAIWGIDSAIAYGVLYAIHYGGILYAYNITTGKLMWQYANADLYGRELRNTNFPSDIDFITDGMIVISPAEFNPTSPRPFGSNTVCLNATTGQVIWSLSLSKPGGSGEPIIGDNIIAALNTYDNQIYAIGKGPTKVTVQAPLAAITLGNSLVVSGTVTDISAGTTQSGIAARFPNGVPAVSDDSQGAWMQYVYMQFPQPTNATGVPVTLTVLDANGNYRQIGTTISDSNGFFTINWKPDIPGQYTVYATFSGTNSYWPSSAETSFAVDSASPTASPLSVQAQPPFEMYIAIGVVAIIVAIAIVGAVMVIMLKKRA